MKIQCLSSDIISTLPQNIIEKILCSMSIRDAVRTSILSSKWRYSWTSIPTLTFDDDLFLVSSDSKQEKKHKFVNAIFQVLLLHRGPLPCFTLCIGEINMTPEIDPMILYLSKSNTLKIFYLENKLEKRYKIPYVLSSFHHLEDLVLKYCSFELPLTFTGLGTLRILVFYNVRIAARTLQRLLVNCPKLKTLVLYDCPYDFREGIKFTFVELFECLPSIVHVDISSYYVKYLAASGMPTKLSTSLVHLKMISLEVCFIKQDELSSLLCIIRSSPNLEKINIWMWDNDTLVPEASMNFFDLQDYSSYKLNHLEDLKIEGFKNLPPETEFVKLIMAKSPLLKKVQIKLKSTMSVDEEVKMLRDFVLHPFPRASPSAKLIIKR